MRGAHPAAADPSDITFDDFAQFGASMAPHISPPAPPGGGGGGGRLGRLLGDDFTRPEAPYRPAQSQVQAKRSLLSYIEDDGHDNQQDEASPLGVRSIKRQAAAAPDLSELMKGYNGPPIITTSTGRKPLIPYDVYAAAQTLLDADRDGDVRLQRSFSGELQQVLLQCRHEFVSIDPPVLISDSIPVGQGVVLYVEEAVPVSLLLLALFMRSAYKVPGTYDHRPYEQIKMQPYEGRIIKGAQQFGLKDQVERELQERGFDVADVMRNIQLLMMRIGEIASQEACDGIWLDDVIQQLGRVIKGQHKPVEPDMPDRK